MYFLKFWHGCDLFEELTKEWSMTTKEQTCSWDQHSPLILLQGKEQLTMSTVNVTVLFTHNVQVGHIRLLFSEKKVRMKIKLKVSFCSFSRNCNTAILHHITVLQHFPLFSTLCKLNFYGLSSHLLKLHSCCGWFVVARKISAEVVGFSVTLFQFALPITSTVWLLLFITFWGKCL